MGIGTLGSSTLRWCDQVGRDLAQSTPAIRPTSPGGLGLTSTLLPAALQRPCGLLNPVLHLQIAAT